MKISNIQSPKDIKSLSFLELKYLSNDIRKFLVTSLSKTGGHLASNLGVVELTVALHYAFNSPYDKIVWDVGHQAYVHKILTGRSGKFDSLRKMNGLSGFPKASESEHDHFDAGHSSTSISVATGFCVGRDLKNETNSVIAVIGDGALTGGMAYEALNNAGRLKSNLIVILNDNQMSISKNVGAISKNLNKLRTSKPYLNAKIDVSQFLESVPLVGTPLRNTLEKSKNILRNSILPGAIFEELGFKYVGIIDGHNIKELVKTLNNCRNIKGPVLIHVNTVKGKGYKNAEDSPENFHGIGEFHIGTGELVKAKTSQTYTDVFASKLIELAKENDKILAITAAMPTGTGLSKFQKVYPKRFFDVGIAEAHAVTFAGGLAKEGFIPVFAVYSTFLQRAYDQIIHDICIQNLKVIFAIDRSGVVGEDGETHQGVFDIPFLLTIPNMKILAPKNKKELMDMLEYAVSCDGPVAIRYPRGNSSDVLEECTTKIIHGKSEIIFQGEEIALVSVGTMMDNMHEVYKRLCEKGYKPTLINARFLKPVDEDLIKELGKYKYVFLAEDCYGIGGFGSYIYQKMESKSIAFHNFSYSDDFISQGSVGQIQEKYGLDVESIENKIMEIIWTN